MTPSRLAFRSSADTTGEVQRVLSKLEESGRDLPITRLVANWQTGFRPFILMADALLVKGVLPAITREMIVLHIASVQGLDYEWHEHEIMARKAGLSSEQIEALAEPVLPSGPEFDRAQLAALTLVNQVLTRHDPEPATWDEVCALMGEEAALELVFAVAWWGGFVPVAVRALFPLAGAEES